jgi:hypothetical protein
MRSRLELYRTQEPNGLPREESVVWKMAFTALWNDKISKGQIAAKRKHPAKTADGSFLVQAVAGQPETGGADTTPPRSVSTDDQEPTTD